MITRRTPIMGNGREEKPLFAGLESPAIAHHELAASARVGAFEFRSEISQGIARRGVGNLSVDQKEKSARVAQSHFGAGKSVTSRASSRMPTSWRLISRRSTAPDSCSSQNSSPNSLKSPTRRRTAKVRPWAKFLSDALRSLGRSVGIMYPGGKRW